MEPKLLLLILDGDEASWLRYSEGNGIFFTYDEVVEFCCFRVAGNNMFETFHESDNFFVIIICKCSICSYLLQTPFDLTRFLQDVASVDQ